MSEFKVYKKDTEVLVEDATHDTRMGKQFSRRITWLTGDPDRPYLSLTSTTYANGMVLRHDGETEREARNIEEPWDEDLPVWDGVRVEEFPEDQLFLQLYEYCEDEWLWHTDPEDLGGSEVYSEYEYDTIGYTFMSSLEKSQEFCREHLAEADYFDNYSPENT